MPKTPCARRIPGSPFALLALLGSALLALPVAAVASNYEVVLKDGSSLAAATRPLIAMGKVSFLDGERRSMTLPIQSVDVEATRSRLGAFASHSPTWTDRSLAKVKGKIQIVGESEARPEQQSPEASGDAEASGNAQGGTAAERLRGEIDALSEKMKPLAAKDRQRTLLMLRQLELQQELTRLLRPPVSS